MHNKISSVLQQTWQSSISYFGPFSSRLESFGSRLSFTVKPRDTPQCFRGPFCPFFLLTSKPMDTATIQPTVELCLLNPVVRNHCTLWAGDMHETATSFKKHSSSQDTASQPYIGHLYLRPDRPCFRLSFTPHSDLSPISTEQIESRSRADLYLELVEVWSSVKFV